MAEITVSEARARLADVVNEFAMAQYGHVLPGEMKATHSNAQ